jgi:hypothetical protein
MDTATPDSRQFLYHYCTTPVCHYNASQLTVRDRHSTQSVEALKWASPDDIIILPDEFHSRLGKLGQNCWRSEDSFKIISEPHRK